MSAVQDMHAVDEPMTELADDAANVQAARGRGSIRTWRCGQVRRQADAVRGRSEDQRLQLIGARLVGVAPVTLINARIDPLRSDRAKMEAALKKAKVPVERREYEGVTHEFFGTVAVMHFLAKEAQAYAGERLKSTFSSS
jgi:acetyl esterase/lipase